LESFPSDTIIMPRCAKYFHRDSLAMLLCVVACEDHTESTATDELNVGEARQRISIRMSRSRTRDPKNYCCGAFLVLMIEGVKLIFSPNTIALLL
jgi:hypothetical protein